MAPHAGRVGRLFVRLWVIRLRLAPRRPTMAVVSHVPTARHRRYYSGHRRGAPRHRRASLHNRPIIAVIPARNEPTIGATVRSLLAQTRGVDRVYVIANNCTDGGATARLAAEAGAYVIVMDDNRHLKAGAINRGLDALDAYYPEGECGVILMDADTVLPKDWVEIAERALRHADAVSGAYHGRYVPGLLGIIQRTEFAQAAHRAGQHPLRVSVLSGTATMFRMAALRAVRSARATGALGGPVGCWYNHESIVEDYEITLSLKKLGMAMVCPPGLRVITDVMGTWRDLWRQRVRWQEGTLRTLAQFPLRVTWRAWLTQAWIYLVAVMPIVVIGMTVWSARAGSVDWQWQWLLIAPVVGAAEAWAARDGGKKCVLFAAAILPMWLVGWWRYAVYYWSAARMVFARRRELIWHEG